MVGTRGKASKSKSHGQVLVSDETEPLKIINAEAAGGPYGEEEKAEILNCDVLPAFGDRHEKHIVDAMNDEEENTGFEINYILVDENKAVLTDLDTKDQSEGVNDGVDATTNMDIENSDEKKNGDEPVENMSNRGDVVFNVDAENSNRRTNGEEREVGEDAPIGVEEKGPDVSACVTDANKGLAASVKVPVENLVDNMDYDKGSNELTAEELASTPAENRHKSIEENAGPANGGKAVPENVTHQKKKIIRKKMIRKKILPGKGVTAVNEAKLKPSDGNEGSDVSCKVGTSNEVKPQCQENNEATGEVSKLDNSENVSNKVEGELIVKAKENGNPASEVMAVAETVTQPTKKIIRKKLIRKKILMGKGVTAVKAKPQPSDGFKRSGVLGKTGTSNENNEATGEVSKLDNTENVTKEVVEDEPVAKVNNKRIRIRRKKLKRQSDVPTGGTEPKREPKNDEPVVKENQTIEQEIKNEEAAGAKTRLRLLKKRKNKMVAEEDTHNSDAKDINEPGCSEKGKFPKKIVSMGPMGGMIFMCNSETKKDCYKYKVFGLPAAKKDIVSKIYKGMRLFLFDTNLKMMYGIYKAAAPGSYDVEPKAFYSQYPSQVRFTVLDDCLPIPEEKFKKVIRENYFTKNKFDSHLTNEQVKNLCKLFRETTKKSKTKLKGQIQRAIPPTRVDKKRKRPEDSRQVGPGPISSRDRETRREGLEQVRHTSVIRNHDHLRHAPVIRGHHEMGHALVVRGQAESRPAPVRNHDNLRHALVIGGHHEMGRGLVVRGQEETRPAPVGINNRYHHPVVYERESYLPTVESSSLYQPLRAVEDPRARIYSYERDPGVNTTYRRDPAVEYLDLEVSALQESRQYTDRSLPRPYATYREPQRPQVFCEPVYETDTRREHYDYLSTRVRSSGYYRPDDGRAPLPLHRRY